VRGLRKLRSTESRTRPPTAEEIRAARFGQSPMAWRGFSEEEVVAYLGRVATVVETGEAERAALRAEIDRLRTFYRSHGTEVDAVPVRPAHRPPPSPGDLPSQARQRLDALTANAELYADLLTGGVRPGPDDPPDGRERARELLVHAEVSARIGFEEVLAGFRAAYGDRSPAAVAELRRSQQWLEEFSHALTRQLAALCDAVDDLLPTDELTAR
jgi:DivIVA domain-containing protein